ncbi:lytic transglycosylase domain-containing protein [uncultured Roseobacter sp.]|uniref:lytic transglycosylase domain-containing protein n=1 Tax=uncultured Roseobacter sp. TaxID=114847 RepID=UPI002637B605|nr:lytic transglycosylase domain-containing protein [uncultured Roseobacter sp.]
MVAFEYLQVTKIAFAVFLLSPTELQASAGYHDQENICDAASTEAAASSGVPLQVLKAIARTESGRTRDGTFSAWPWTVNVAGDGRWFSSRTEALSFVRAEIESGETLIDVGCFQINLHWHGDQFGTISEMIDPTANAAYAARFLSQLFFETGDWNEAVGKFHSRTPQHAEKYLNRYNRILASLPGDRPATRNSQTRTNNFPFLKPASESSGIGSLVPSVTGTATSLFSTGNN